MAVYEGPGDCYLWDTEMPGFGLRIYPSGRKSFVGRPQSRPFVRMESFPSASRQPRAVLSLPGPGRRELWGSSRCA